MLTAPHPLKNEFKLLCEPILRNEAAFMTRMYLNTYLFDLRRRKAF